MTFPTVDASTTGASSTTNATSYTPGLPSGSGGLLLAIVSADGVGVLSTTSTGWKRLGYQTHQGTVVSSALFVKEVSDGSDTLVVNNTASEQYTHAIYRIGGSDLKVVANSASGSSTDSNPPNLDVGTSGDYLWIVARSGDSTVVASAAPTNYGSLLSQAAAGTAGASTNAAHRTNAASSENPGVFTSTSEQWVAWTIAIGSGIPTGALRFDAVEEYVSRTANLPAITAFTVSGFARIVADRGSGVTQSLSRIGTPAWAYLTWNECSSPGSMSMGSYDGFDETQAIFTARPAVGDWFFWYIRCSGSGTNALQTGWCDVADTAFTEQKTATLAPLATGTPDAFTSPQDYFDNYSNVDMYGVRMWSTSLSDAELLDEAGSADAVKTANLLIDAPMSAWNQTDADEDQSGNNYDLTIIGSTQAVEGPTFSSSGSPYTLTAASASYTITGTAAALARSRIMAGASGSYALSGTAANFAKGRRMAADTAAYSLTGSAAAFSRTRNMAAASAAYALTGSTVGLQRALKLVAGSGSYAVAGTDVAFRRGRSLAASTAAYALTGADASLRSARLLAALSGSYAVTGTDATLTKAGVGAYTLPAASASYVLTGASVVLRAGRSLSGASAAYALTGSIAAMRAARRIAADTTAYALTGTAASMRRTSSLPAATEAYALTGTAVALRAGRRLSAGTAAYALTGTAALFSRGRPMVAGSGSYSLNGQTVGLRTTYVISAESGVFVVTGQAAALTWSNAPFWVPVGQTGETWSSVAANSETWTPVSATTETWTAA